MGSIKHEPIRELNAHNLVPHHALPIHNLARTHLPNIDALILTIQTEHPRAHIRITGRGRTVERQAELMSERRIQNRHQFLHTYLAAPHITEMDQWVTNHPHAKSDEAVAAFVEIINRARRNGAVVSNHLSDHARDISIPLGDHHYRTQVRNRLQELGAHVIDEGDAVGGPHWHIDY